MVDGDTAYALWFDDGTNPGDNDLLFSSSVAGGAPLRISARRIRRVENMSAESNAQPAVQIARSLAGIDMRCVQLLLAANASVGPAVNARNVRIALGLHNNIRSCGDPANGSDTVLSRPATWPTWPIVRRRRRRDVANAPRARRCRGTIVAGHRPPTSGVGIFATACQATHE